MFVFVFVHACMDKHKHFVFRSIYTFDMIYILIIIANQKNDDDMFHKYMMIAKMIWQ